MDASLQIHRDGRWLPAASLSQLDDHRCRLEYRPAYVFGDDPLPLGLNWPVGFSDRSEGEEGAQGPNLPPFLYDLVPQGRGRAKLLQLLKLADHDRLLMPLLMHGACNPIGCLRISTAVTFYEEQAAINPAPGVPQGFSLVEMQRKDDAFLEHMALHAMLAAGTTGVQGVAPKYLLTQNGEGRWFADLALPDEQAHAHWLVKLPRGRTAADLQVLRNEAAYLRLAGACGLRVHGEPQLHGSMLFVRRFDRERDEARGSVRRLHQESLASLAGLTGFAPASSNNELLLALREHATDPVREMTEFMRRDVLNLALGNTDNHARNSAVQRLADGTIRLTPLYDFAPMFRDPEIVTRSLHWLDAKGRHLKDWREVLDALAEELLPAEVASLATGLRSFAPVLTELPRLASEAGVDADILADCRQRIAAQCDAMERLHG